MPQVVGNEYRKHWYTVHELDTYSEFSHLATIRGRRYDYIQLKANSVNHAEQLVKQFLRGGLSKSED